MSRTVSEDLQWEGGRDYDQEQEDAEARAEYEDAKAEADIDAEYWDQYPEDAEER